MTSVSNTIKLFSNTKYLNLSNNNLREISYNISELPHLQILNVDNNQIEDLPTWIGKRNFKEFFSHYLGTKQSLKILSFENNPVISLFKGIRDLEDCDALKTYLTFNLNLKFNWKLFDIFFR